MDQDGTPGLSVGFEINPGRSVSELERLRAMLNSSEATALKAAAAVEGSFNKLNLGSATAQVTAFGNAHTREMQSAARENAKVEKSGEAMVRQLARQAETFGKTSSEIRAMRAELRAVEAEGRGMTDLAARIRFAAAEIDRMETSTTRLTPPVRLAGHHAQNLAFQFQDLGMQMYAAAGSSAPFKMAMTALIQQGTQIQGIMSQAGIGIRGLAVAAAGMAAPFLPAIAAVGALTAGLGLFVRYVNDGVTNDQLTRDLGKITGGADATKQELYKLKDETVTWGDTTSALFSVVGKDIAEGFVGDISGMVDDVKILLDNMTAYGKATLAGMYAGVAGTKAYLGEVSKPGAITDLILGRDPKLFERTYGKAYDEADKYLTKLGARVKAQAIQNARTRLADKIGYNAPDKPKADRSAERLARENAAIEAQIKNLYALANAYGVSGAAALIAEARAKAESDAIKKRGDVELFVAREIQLVVAQRTADAAKSAFTMRQQADLQAEVNTMVAQGLIPAERANELLQDRIADLPILQAIEAAYQVGRVADAQKAEKQLKALQDARLDRDAARTGAWFTGADTAADRRLAEWKQELALVGATDAVRVRALATIRATNDALANKVKPGDPYFDKYVSKQVEIAELEHQRQLRLDAFNNGLRYQADLLGALADNVARAGQGMEEAFGRAGGALGDLATRFSGFVADQKRLKDVRDEQLALARQNNDAESRAAAEQRINGLYAAKNLTARVGLYGDLAAASRGFFKEDSDGYKAATAALKIFRAVEFALSARAIAQDAIETGSSIAKSGARAASSAVEAVAKAIASLPFPANLAAGAATAAALAAIGLSIAGSFGGHKNTLSKANNGTGTVLGDADAKSESIRRAIDGLKEVDTLMLNASRDMAASLRSIDSQISGVATLVVRAGNIDANAGVAQGFKANAIGSILGNVPLIGGLLKSLFGTSTTVIGSGLYGGAQSVGSILSNGFDASYYSDVERKKKFLGITTGKSYSTEYGAADAGIEGQFTLILRQFNDAIKSAAGPLGVATDEISQRLNGFVVNIGKIDTKGLTGAEIEEKLAAVFGAAADGMAAAAVPGLEKWQKVGEGAFETLVRVASTVETVTASLDQMGNAARGLSVDAKLGIAGRFDTLRDFTSAADAYFEAYYTDAERNAATLARFGQVFMSLGVALPDTLAGFRALVEAQDLTTAAGQATYATLLQLAPAFADLKGAMDGAKSAADILAERGDLERKLLELAGDTAAIRALDLAKLDASNRALQQQVWAIEDAQEAARAADELRKAWGSVGDSIMDEVRRIRGLTESSEGGSYASLLGRFNAVSVSARGGDQDAAKSLPGLSQELLRAAENAARSRQELDGVRAQTATSLEETYAAISKLSGAPSPATSTQALLGAMFTQQTAATAQAASEGTASEIRLLRDEVRRLRDDNNAGHAATAGNTNAMKRTLENVTANSGDAIRTEAA